MNKSSFKDFNLSEDILKTLQILDYENPSEVQEKVIPFALEDKDIIVKSQTGSGKTAAFAIPICEKIELEEKRPQALVLTPTRELAIQIKEDITNIGRFKRIKCATVFGKQPINIQIRQLRQRTHIVVGTPGRTFDHIERKTLNLECVKYLIIDEADKMLNMGFIDQVESIMKMLPKNRVTMLFSATMPEEIEKLCRKHMIDPLKIEINTNNITTEKIHQGYYKVEKDEKFSLLTKIIYTERPDSCIIFCNTKAEVDNVLKRMEARKYSCLGLHGGMEQDERLESIELFKRGGHTFLVATDVMARGIHVDDVTHVINYDIPMEKESYVHRIGRTGRAGNEGTAITFITPYEDRFFDSIEEYLGYKIPEKEIPSEELVEEGKILFKEKNKVKPKLKKNKSDDLNKKITKLHINAGKKKKVRPGDIVGAITNIEGVTQENIGIIDVQESFSYVDILGGKGSLVQKNLEVIKGKKVKIEMAKK